MRVAWDAVGGPGASFERQGEQLMVGGKPLNGDTVMVDHVKTLVGGVATVFMGDTRVATNVAKPDGARAVGTPLAKGPVYDAVLGRGEPYRGETKILGKPYFAAYDPIKTASGEVIGILFVGVRQGRLFPTRLSPADLAGRRRPGLGRGRRHRLGADGARASCGRCATCATPCSG
jgi:methyl-accepting chemotaxis protein